MADGYSNMKPDRCSELVATRFRFEAGQLPCHWVIWVFDLNRFAVKPGLFGHGFLFSHAVAAEVRCDQALYRSRSKMAVGDTWIFEHVVPVPPKAPRR